jgi:hypothetical protein
MNTITLTSRLRLRDNVHATDIDDAVVIANGSDSDCYGLEFIARRIWQLLDRTGTAAELCDALLNEYDIDRETCEREVLEFLNDSLREGIIEIAA